MKSKLTVTIDYTILSMARRYAEGKGESLSSLVEDALREMTKEMEPTFSEKWRGRFKYMTDDEIESARYEFLARKYGL